jgi:4-hydroxybutyrate CoA-transferase
MATSSDWRKRHADRLCGAADAVSLVKSGNQVYAGGWTSVPLSLCAALAARHGELHDVGVVTFLTPFAWDRPELLESFRITTAYTGPNEREAVRAGRFEYVPIVQFREGQAPPGIDLDYDVAMIPISPPDERGHCSFGGAVWFGPTISRRARALIGEVHPEFIRTGGANTIHVSRFDRLVEVGGPVAAPPIAPRSEETAIAAEIICTLVALEIIPDGATLQMGVGDVSAALPVFLGDKHDLGIHTEILPGGVADLMKRGVITGKRKTVHPGKVVASALVQMPPEELAELDGHPDVELYDFTHTDDLATLLKLENFVAVNNALAVDVTGNVSSETNGPQVFSGPGGQPTFALAASVTSGSSVIVLPSSQLVGTTRHSRIVATHPAGATVTVHRGCVDIVVTEQGIARLRGKTLRRRIDELVAVAHPDFRSELRSEARRLYGV